MRPTVDAEVAWPWARSRITSFSFPQRGYVARIWCTAVRSVRGHRGVRPRRGRRERSWSEVRSVGSKRRRHR